MSAGLGASGGFRSTFRDFRERARAQSAQIDQQPQPDPEDAEVVHRERERALLATVDVGEKQQELIDRVSTGEFFTLLVTEYGKPGSGSFVDLGSGRYTANIVSYVALVWPLMFTDIHAVDVTQNIRTVEEVTDMRRRVGGVLKGVSAEKLGHALKKTARIAWWHVPTPDNPETVVTSFAGVTTTNLRTSYLLSTSTFILSVDLLFLESAWMGYRREIADSLIDDRTVTFVTCHPVGSTTMRTAPFGKKIKFPDGTDDLYIGRFIKSCTKIQAQGQGVHVAWDTTTFYVIRLKGPNPAADRGAPHTDEGGAAAAAASAAAGAKRTDEDRVVAELIHAVTTHTQLLDHVTHDITGSDNTRRIRSCGCGRSCNLSIHGQSRLRRTDRAGGVFARQVPVHERLPRSPRRSISGHRFGIREGRLQRRDACPAHQVGHWR